MWKSCLRYILMGSTTDIYNHSVSVALALIVQLRGRWADRSWTQLLWSALSLCAYPTDPSPPLNITHYPWHKHTRTLDNLTTSPLPSPSNHLCLTIMCLAAIIHSTCRGHIAASLLTQCCMSCQWCVYIYMIMYLWMKTMSVRISDLQKVAGSCGEIAVVSGMGH